MKRKSNAFQRLLDVVDQILGIFKTAGDSDKARGNASGSQLFIGHLTMGGGGGAEAAGACIRDMGFDGGKLERFHEAAGSFAAALELKGNNATGAVGQIFLLKRMIRIGGQVAVVNDFDLLMGV